MSRCTGLTSCNLEMCDSVRNHLLNEEPCKDIPPDNVARWGASGFVYTDTLESLILDDPRLPPITPAPLPPPVPSPPPPDAPVPLLPATVMPRVRLHL